MSKDKKSNYYDVGGIEVLDIIKAKLTPEQYTGYLLGNTIKYACRLNFKGNMLRDAEKVKNYTAWLSDEIKTGYCHVVHCDPPGDGVCGGACDCSECDHDFIDRIGGEG